MRNIRKGSVILLALLVGISFMAVADYSDTDIRRGYEPTQGDEWLFDEIPVMPLSALTLDVTEATQTASDTIGTAPSGSVIMATYVDVIGTFGSSSDLSVGTSGTPDAYVGTGDVDPSSTGGTLLPASQSSALSSDTDVIVQHDTSSGEQSSESGEARVTILYLIPPE